MADINALLEQSPLPSLIEGIGVAISRAQLAMDQSAVKILFELAETKVKFQERRLGTDGKPTLKAGGGAYEMDDVQRSLLELGFAPTFYSIAEVTLEARVAFSTTTSKEVDATASLRIGSPVSIVCANVDAHYSNKYSFSGEGSSSIKARFVALPSPPQLREAIDRQIAAKSPPKTP